MNNMNFLLEVKILFPREYANKYKLGPVLLSNTYFLLFITIFFFLFCFIVTWLIVMLSWLLEFTREIVAKRRNKCIH
jgi:hypothetical protein